MTPQFLLIVSLVTCPQGLHSFPTVNVCKFLVWETLLFPPEGFSRISVLTPVIPADFGNLGAQVTYGPHMGALPLHCSYQQSPCFSTASCLSQCYFLWLPPPVPSCIKNSWDYLIMFCGIFLAQCSLVYLPACKNLGSTSEQAILYLCLCFFELCISFAQMSG